MIRHVEAESYVKKLLADNKIDLPFYLKQSAPTPVSSRCDSVASTSRTSVGQALSSRESMCAGSVVHLKPVFGRGFIGKILKHFFNFIEWLFEILFFRGTQSQIYKILSRHFDTQIYDQEVMLSFTLGMFIEISFTFQSLRFLMMNVWIYNF